MEKRRSVCYIESRLVNKELSMISLSHRRRRVFLAAPTLLFLSILHAPVAAAKDARVSGNISYRERIALPPGFVARVELLDISRQDAAAKTVNSIELTPAHQIPIPYEIGFDKTRINPRHSYAVRGQIFVEGRLWFTSTQVIPVITRGAPHHADILLQRAASPQTGNEAASNFVGDWLVEDISGRGVTDTLQSTLTFDANGRVYGMGGCNRFTGGVTSSADGLSFGPLAATQMACPPAIADQESRYFAALTAVRKAHVEGPFLILRAADGTPLVKLTRKQT
jgi:putative lipoprotein